MLALTVYRFSPVKITIWAIDLRATASTPTALTVKQASSAEIGNSGWVQPTPRSPDKHQPRPEANLEIAMLGLRKAQGLLFFYQRLYQRLSSLNLDSLTVRAP